MLKAIERVEAELGREYPIIVGGERIKTGDLHESLNPSKFAEVIGRVHNANRDVAEKAITAAWRCFRYLERCSRRAACILSPESCSGNATQEVRVQCVARARSRQIMG